MSLKLLVGIVSTAHFLLMTINNRFHLLKVYPK